MVEITNHGDPFRTRRPYREGDALDAVDLTNVRAELLVCQVVVTTAKIIDIILRQTRQEAVGIIELTNLAIVALDAQTIIEVRGAPLDDAFEKPSGLKRSNG